MFNQIMLDIETIGTLPGSVIVTIGACAFNFDANEISKETFYININPKSCVQAGLTMDADTVMWWMQQSDAARNALISKNAMTLKTAMQRLGDWVTNIRMNAPRQEIGVWGNGASFDLVLLERAFSAVGETVPWAFWDHRDVRTLVWLGKTRNFDPKKDMPFEGTAHNALADAMHQAKYCMAIKQVLDKVG